jgi:Carboxypeptidase regulatory-like domain
VNRLLLCGTFLLSVAIGALAQEGGSIRGTVTDQSGAAIVGARITITSSATKVTTSVNSNTAGIYNVGALPSGTYRVTAAAQGFETVVHNDIVVDLATVTGLNLQLQIGASTQQVEVTGAAPILNTQESSSSTAIAVDAYASLPLSAGGGRNASSFTTLTPGVNENNSVNGAPQESAQVTLGGITVQNAEAFGATNNIRFPPEAVEEMSIVTSAYSAEYGNTGGGVQRYEIKSGTNLYHGNVYEYFKNTIFDARGYFNSQTPIDRQNEYGFSLGGPVSIPKVYDGKNRSFFFFNGDWFVTAGGRSTVISSLPSSESRDGDFSEYLGAQIPFTNPCAAGPVFSGQIFDPATTRTVNGQLCSTPFPGNVIPANRISRAAENLLAILPPTTTGTPFNNIGLQRAPSFNNFHDYTMKFDQYFGSNHHFSGLFGNSANPSGGGSLLSPPLWTTGTTYWAWDVARVTYSWIINANLLNELRLGYNREIFSNTPTGSEDPGWQNDLGIPGYQTASNLFPGFIWSDGDYQTLGNQQFWDATSNTYVLSDTLSWTKGRHTLQFGGEDDDLWHALYKDWPAQFTISRNETALPSALGSTGEEAASLLLGLIDTSNIPQLADTHVNYKWQTFGLYAQDSYKVTPHLTLNYGLRWDLFLPMVAPYNNIMSAVNLSMQNPSAGNLPGTYVFAGTDGQGSCLSSACNDAHGIAPRLGLAWQVAKRFVFRGGYGISYYPTGLYGAGNNVYLTDGYDPTSAVSTPDNGVTPGMTLAQGFPADRLQVRNLSPSVNIGSNFDYWSKTAQRVANVQSWNVSLETQLASSLSLDVAWVGTKGTRLSMLQNINQVNPSYLSLGTSLLNSNIDSPAVVAAGFTAPWPGFATALGANATLAQALRPYPQYLHGFGYNSDNEGNSTYNALQVKLNKHMSNGLYLLMAYTYDKSITDANSTLYSVPGNNPIGTGEVIDQYNFGLSKTVASAWQPNVFTTAFVYDLPIGPSKRFLNKGGVVGAVIGGWQLGGVLTYETGALISVPATQALPLFAGPSYATIVSGVRRRGTWNGRFNPATDRYLNVNAFQVPASGTFGGKQYLPNLFAPSYKDEDLSISRSVKLTERWALQLRLETFNAFNRAVFGAPTSNISNPASFGEITTQANSPRQAQLVGKITF